jgi:hypothetical protein
MFGQMFTSVEIMSSVILGGATVSAAALNFMNEARKAKRAPKEIGPKRGWMRRPLILLAVTAVGVGLWMTYATSGAQATALAGPRSALRKLNNMATAQKDTGAAKRSVKPGAAAPLLSTVPVSNGPAGRLEEWLQAEGTKLYYRYTKYLPDACPGSPIAIGNWAEGELRPVAARCIDGGWIALDLGPLVQEGRIVPNMTYCVNFRAANGAWGIHVPEGAPGIDSVGVPAVRVPLGHAIGVRYLPGNPRERVVPTSDTPRAPC